MAAWPEDKPLPENPDEFRQARLEAWQREEEAKTGKKPELLPRSHEFWYLPPLPQASRTEEEHNARHAPKSGAHPTEREAYRRAMEKAEKQQAALADRCEPYFLAYLNCAQALQEGPQGGMTLNNECELEKERYKRCRRLEAEQKRKLAEQSDRRAEKYLGLKRSDGAPQK